MERLVCEIRPTTDVRFSNRPSGVKHFQTVHHCNVDVTHGLALLSGIGTRALPSWDPRTRRNNLWVGLAVRRRQVQAELRTHLIHRPARDIFPPQGGTELSSYRVVMPLPWIVPGSNGIQCRQPRELEEEPDIATTKAIPPDIVSEEFARFSLK